MKAQPKSYFPGAPHPSRLDESEKFYQVRQGVSPTKTIQEGWKDSKEDGLRRLDPTDHVMAYTEVNDRAPTAQERGVPTTQASKGAGDVDLRYEKFNHGMR